MQREARHSMPLVVRDRRADQRMVGKTKFKASEWPFPLVDFVLHRRFTFAVMKTLVTS